MAIEQRITENLFIEFGFNYEDVHELRGGPFFEAESINIVADPNRMLPGGTAARPQTAANPHAGLREVAKARGWTIVDWD